MWAFEDLLPATVDPEFAHLRGNDRFRRARISQLEKVADKLEGEIDESDETLKKLEKMFGDDGEYESQYARLGPPNTSVQQSKTNLEKEEEAIGGEIKSAWELLAELENHVNTKP